MPKFRVRLEAQDGSRHFRESTIGAESKAEGEAILKRREEEYALYRLTTAEIAEFETKYGVDVIQAALALGPDSKISEIRDSDDNPLIPIGVRGKIAAHRQAAPYEIVGSEKESGS